MLTLAWYLLMYGQSRLSRAVAGHKHSWITGLDILALELYTRYTKYDGRCVYGGGAYFCCL